MRRGLVLIVLLLLPCFTLSAQFDSDNDEDIFVTVYVFAQFDQNSPQMIRLLDELQAALQVRSAESEGVRLLVDDDPDFGDILINLDLAQGESILSVDIMPVTAYLDVLPSWSIVPHMYTLFPLQVDASDSSWLELTVTVTQAIAAYMVGDCDEAYLNLFDAFDLIEELEEFFVGHYEQMAAYLLFYVGLCEIIEGEYDDAIESFETMLAIYDAMRFEPRFYGMEARLNLAWLLMQSGQTEEALALVNDVVGSQFDIERLDGLLLRAEIYALNGEINAALDDLLRAESLRSYDDGFLTMRFAYLRILSGDFLGAEGEIFELEKTVPDWPEVIYYRGLLAYTEGFPLEALDYFYEYIELDPFGYFVDEVSAYIAEIESGS